MDVQKGSEEMKKTSLNLPVELWRRLRVRAAESDVKLGDLIARLLAEKLEQEESERRR